MRADVMRVQVTFTLFRFPGIALPTSFFIQLLFFIAHLMSPYFSWCIPIFHVYHLSFYAYVLLLFSACFTLMAASAILSMICPIWSCVKDALSLMLFVVKALAIIILLTVS